jgi:hypothetical protein
MQMVLESHRLDFTGPKGGTSYLATFADEKVAALD